MSEETEEQKREAHAGFSFNTKRSASISVVDRQLPDGRATKCRKINLWEGLQNGPSLTVSIIIVFLNEPSSTLYRTIHALLNRTPPRLLHEILLVDDGSDAEWLQQPLEQYLNYLPAKVKLVRSPRRVGLMGARTRGAEHATGDILLFLDCHVEPVINWLEPLVARIETNRSRVVMPIIDQIEPDSFEYVRGGIDILGFTWQLTHSHPGRTWEADSTHPIPSPIMAGGLFAIDRAHFWRLGGYDPLMREWGGEEFELSFRIWMCGGSLELVPCSRVAHVFRSRTYAMGQGYMVDYNKVLINKRRVAEVWMDEFKELVFPHLPTSSPLGDLEPRQRIRKELQCKSFAWYLQNVYPELFNPLDPVASRKSGELRNLGTSLCLSKVGDSQLSMSVCNKGLEQRFTRTHKNEFRLWQTGFSECLDAGGPESTLILFGCHNLGGNQLVDEDKPFPLALSVGGSCVEAISSGGRQIPVMRDCDPSNPNQKWAHILPDYQ